jgi:chaperonin GroES
MKIKPLGDRVLVQRMDVEEKKGGIIIPDAAKEKPKTGKIIALGLGKRDEDGKRIEFSVKKGDKVLFESYAGTEVTIEGEEYLIMREDSIIGVVN